MDRIYVDHAATTPLHPQVLTEMSTLLANHVGNPSSIHHFGRQGRAKLDEARSKIAAHLGTKEHNLVFTSGGTEAANLAVIGTALANQDKGKHIITTQIEHHAVLHSCQYLETLGFEVTYVPVNQSGQVELETLQECLREDTILVSIMYANNEIGTLQPIEQIGQLLREREIIFHTDAVQALGMIPLDLDSLPVDLLSASSHKINGPQGVGLLYADRHVRLQPLLHGGAQERNRRAGTENLAGLIGFAKAVELAYAELAPRQKKYAGFKKQLVASLREAGLPFTVNGHPEQSVAHILNISFAGIPADVMLMNLDMAGVAASSGSACTAGSLQPSHVLEAIYPEGDERISSAIRFSFGLGNTEEEIEKIAQHLTQIVQRIKS